MNPADSHPHKDNMVTPKEIKEKLIANGYSTSPGLLAETIYAYVLDERERCAKLVETMSMCCSLPYDEWHGVCHTQAARLIRESTEL